MILRLTLHVLFVLFIQVGLGHAATFQAKVIHVADGDTITVLNDSNRQIKIRLNGIDCPEKAQAYGNQAKQFTKDLVHGELVTINTMDKDRYGRTIGEVFLDDGRNLNQELVKAGYAWWYRKYAPGNLVLMKMEADAKEAKLGLWNDPEPIPPWTFRNLIRDEPLGVGEIPDFNGPSERGPPSFGQSLNLPLTPLGFPILGNRRSHIYHRPDCLSYSQIASHNRVPFPNAAEAEAAGYRQAGNCPH